MKQQWDNLSKSIGEVHTNLNTFFEGITEKKYSKAIKIVKELWNKVILLQNEFDKLVEPVKPTEIKLPFTSQEFTELWVFYKDYLLESHRKYLGSRHELMMIKRLSKLANKNERKAIEMLEFFMANGYKGMFIPTEKQLTGEEPADIEEVQSSNFDPNAKKVDI